MEKFSAQQANLTFPLLSCCHNVDSSYVC